MRRNLAIVTAVVLAPMILLTVMSLALGTPVIPRVCPSAVAGRGFNTGPHCAGGLLGSPPVVALCLLSSAAAGFITSRWISNGR